MDPVRDLVVRLRGAGRRAVPELARGTGLASRPAAAAYAAAAAAVLAGLARHAARRGGPDTAVAVIAKWGRPADVAAPALAVAAHLSRPDLHPRLGGLLGDDADRVCAWLASRYGGEAGAHGRALAASAPLVLGALDPAPAALAHLLAGVEPEALDAPEAWPRARGAVGAVFRRLSRSVLPWWRRVGRL